MTEGEGDYSPLVGGEDREHVSSYQAEVQQDVSGREARKGQRDGVKLTEGIRAYCLLLGYLSREGAVGP